MANKCQRVGGPEVEQEWFKKKRKLNRKKSKLAKKSRAKNRGKK